MRKLFDTLISCGVRGNTLNIFYPFQFNEGIDEAAFRLRCSIASLIDQDVCINVMNTSLVDIWKYIKEYERKINYVHLPIELDLYCKSLTINLGVKRFISSEYFVMSDIDLIYPPSFIDVMKLFTNCKEPLRVVFFNSNLANTLIKPQTYEECKHIYNQFSQQEQKKRTYYAPGNGLVHTDSFHLIGGYDERFRGHGSEDGDFNYRISKISKYIEIDLPELNTYHLYHTYGSRIKDTTEFNRRLWRFITVCGNKCGFELIRAGDIKIPRNIMELKI